MALAVIVPLLIFVVRERAGKPTLLGIFASGVISATLAKKPLPARTFRFGPAWRVPMGAVVITTCGMIGVAGFPLDDLWHRLFGQDVTEWGPTHILMIGGTVQSHIGIMLLIAEARQVGARGATGRAGRLWGAFAGGMWITTITVFLMEFELGVPQFPLLNQVVLVSIAATWVLVYARVQFGPGGALIAIGLYVALRCLLYVVVIPFDLTSAPFLPYAGEAILIEVVALAIKPSRGYASGLAVGLAVGTQGVLSEWPMTHLFMPQAWPAGPQRQQRRGAAPVGGRRGLAAAERRGHRPQLAVGHLVAGRRLLRYANGQGRRRRLPDHGAGAGIRQLEVRDPAAHRQQPDGGAAGVPAARSGDRGARVAESGTTAFGPEHELRQCERKPGVPEWLWAAGFVVVGAVWCSAWILWAWMYTVAAGSTGRRSARNPERELVNSQLAGCWGSSRH